MKRKLNFTILILVALAMLITFSLLIRNGNMQLLNPQGYVAEKQSILLISALLLGLFLGVPVVGLTLFIAFRYKDDNQDNKIRNYSPDWKASKTFIAAWWIAPAALLFFWGIIGWQYVHQLDPYKPLDTNIKPVEIQVVALQWKWLFIYPGEHIATVNYIEFPVNTPINFKLTADNAPMNSFWIPSLGSQIYAMAGMETQLHLIANNTGEFPGSDTEMSGEGFSGMDFVAKSTSTADFNNWVQTIRQSGKTLDLASYTTLSKPSSYNAHAFYNYTDNNLFNKILMKYMSPGSGMHMTNTHI